MPPFPPPPFPARSLLFYFLLASSYHRHLFIMHCVAIELNTVTTTVGVCKLLANKQWNDKPNEWVQCEEKKKQLFNSSSSSSNHMHIQKYILQSKSICTSTYYYYIFVFCNLKIKRIWHIPCRRRKNRKTLHQHTRFVRHTIRTNTHTYTQTDVPERAFFFCYFCSVCLFRLYVWWTRAKQGKRWTVHNQMRSAVGEIKPWKQYNLFAKQHQVKVHCFYIC